MGNRILVSLTLLFVIGIFPISAQSPEDISSKMDEIKLNDAFIYGEGNSPNRDIAYGNALNDLTYSANEIRIKENLETIESSSLQPLAKELYYFADDEYTVVVYIEVESAISLKRTNRTATPLQTHISNDSKINIDTANKITFVPAVNQQVPTDKPAFFHSSADEDVLETICGQDNWDEIKGFVSQYKKNGRIKEFGATTSISDVPDDAYIMLYDKYGGILCVLSPRNRSVRLNHKTNLEDNESNYITECKFITWYK